MADEILQKKALSNALSSLIEEKRLPEKVFVGQWKDYLFFESDLMFEEGFINIAKVLLREEQAGVIALTNLSFSARPETFFFENGTEWPDYYSKLVGDGAAINWIFLRDRYVCASDKGEWVIYCERQNDVAVFAFRGLSRPTIAEIRQLLLATSIKAATSLVSPEGFDFGKLVPRWRNMLKSEYALNAAL